MKLHGCLSLAQHGGASNRAGGECSVDQQAWQHRHGQQRGLWGFGVCKSGMIDVERRGSSNEGYRLLKKHKLTSSSLLARSATTDGCARPPGHYSSLRMYWKQLRLKCGSQVLEYNCFSLWLGELGTMMHFFVRSLKALLLEATDRSPGELRLASLKNEQLMQLSQPKPRLTLQCRIAVLFFGHGV